jgi:hypothetical protein
MNHLPSLNTEEKKIALDVKDLLSKRVGKAYPISNDEIIRRIQQDKKVTLTSPKVRKIIQYLRTNKECPICASSKGYYWALNREEIEEFCHSLKDRLMAMRATLNSMVNMM